RINATIHPGMRVAGQTFAASAGLNGNLFQPRHLQIAVSAAFVDDLHELLPLGLVTGLGLAHWHQVQPRASQRGQKHQGNNTDGQEKWYMNSDPCPPCGQRRFAIVCVLNAPPDPQTHWFASHRDHSRYVLKFAMWHALYSAPRSPFGLS